MKKGPRKYGILESDLKDIVSILATNPKTEGVILFGSRAKKDFEPGSDIDICWQGSGLNLKDVTRASLMYEELYLPYKLDIVLHHNIRNPELLEHIDRVGKVLYPG